MPDLPDPLTPLLSKKKHFFYFVTCPVCNKEFWGFTKEQALNNLKIHIVSKHKDVDINQILEMAKKQKQSKPKAIDNV